MLLPSAGGDVEPLTRFRTEAEALARLQHPNIVAIYDIDTFDGQPYFTMEYVAGPSLAQLLQGRPQSPRDAAHLLEVLARAVHAVHACGIIHRDLKPANVLLQGEQSAICTLQFAVPKITDFGLAKDQTAARRLTQSGVAMGTPCYMAPEQANHRAGVIGPATDIYALGSIFYEMLTGRPPFEAQTPAQTIDKLLHDEPLAPLQLRPTLPPDLATICMKCLEKSPWRRYETALELAEELRRFLGGEPIRTRPVGRIERAALWCMRRPLVAGLVAVSVLLALGLVTTAFVYEQRLRQALERQTEEQVQVIVQQRQQIVELNVNIGTSSLAGADVLTALLRFTEALRLDEPAQAAGHRLRIARVLQHCPDLVRLVTLNEQVLGTTMCVRAEFAVTATPEHTLSVWDLRSGKPTVRGLEHAGPPRRAAVSADGRHLAVAGDARLAVWELSARRARELDASPDRPITRLAFHPDGSVLLARRADGSVALWDTATWTALAADKLAKDTLSFSDFSDDGRWLFTVDARRRGLLWSVATRTSQPLALPIAQPPARLAFSEDGERVATVQDGCIQVWHTTSGEQLAAVATPDPTALHFSPDGRRLFSHGAGGARLWDAATGEPLTPQLRHGEGHLTAAYQADMERVVTVSPWGHVCYWRLRATASAEPGPDDRPLEVLQALAELLRGARIDDQQRLVPLEVEQLRRHFNTLRTEGP
jgi:hypothetical protein